MQKHLKCTAIKEPMFSSDIKASIELIVKAIDRLMSETHLTNHETGRCLDMLDRCITILEKNLR